MYVTSINLSVKYTHYLTPQCPNPSVSEIVVFEKIEQ